MTPQETDTKNDPKTQVEVKLGDMGKEGNGYEKLFRKISDIYNFGLHQNYTDLNRFTLETNWKIGEQIVEVDTKSVATESPNAKSGRSRYGEKVLERLSEDLTKEYGIEGFSVTNLRRMRKFHTLYELPKINYGLTWSHYRLLVTIQDEKIRRKIEKEIQDHNWSFRELLLVIQKKYSKYSEEGSGRKDRKSLKYPVGKLNHYRVNFGDSQPHKFGRSEAGRNSGLNSVHSVPNLDFGFKVFFELPVGSISKPVNDEILEVHKVGNDFRLKRSNAEKKELYTYKAYLNRIVDGDTLVVTLDFGFGVRIQQKLRLRGINAPELNTNEGKEAKRFVSTRLKDCDFVVIKTHSEDKYDRYLADVLYLGKEKNAVTVLREGNFLNQELLNEGYAEIVG